MKKIAALALVAVLALMPISLVGCGGSSDSGSNDSNSSTQASESEASDADSIIDAAVKEAEAQGKKVTNTEKFDDCDGSGHGVATITFEDGSTQDVEY